MIRFTSVEYIKEDKAIKKQGQVALDPVNNVE
jgi:hypothetical protein